MGRIDPGPAASGVIDQPLGPRPRGGADQRFEHHGELVPDRLVDEFMLVEASLR